MLHSAHQLPSLEAWNALEHARVLPEIAQRANRAVHGKVGTSGDERQDLESFALPQLLRADRITAWSSIVGQALSEYTSELDTSLHRKLTSSAHPVAIGVSLFQERLMDFQSLGFSSPHALARAAAACTELLYCINRCDEYWVSKDGRLTFVSRNVHGDMHIAQVSLSTESRVPDPTIPTQLDLFAPTVPHDNAPSLIEQGTLPVGPISTLNQWQDWSPMLGSLLIFARKAGMTDLREIKEYSTILAELERSAAATGEAMFGTDMMFLPSFVREHSVLDLTSALVEFPNTFCASPGENASIYMAVLYDKKLWFPRTNDLTKRARESATTETPFADCLRQQLLAELQNDASASQIVRFSVDDLPQALRATYRLFCRDPRRVEALLRLFTDPTSADEQG